MRWPIFRVAVAERSMEPALRPGDWLLVRRALGSRRPVTIRPGRIVVARHPERTSLLIIKRAVRQDAAGWWLGSDNSAAAASDSRQFGPVAADLIEGLVLLRYRRAGRDRR